MQCILVNQTDNTSYEKYEELFNEIFLNCVNFLEKKGEYCISIILVDSVEIHEINKTYRGIDRSTDVISFAALEGEQFSYEDEIELGDIFINIDAVKEQAKEYNHSEKREIGFLFVHGLLHCFGYDHLTSDDEKVMIELQKQILDPIVSRND